jgi:transposase
MLTLPSSVRVYLAAGATDLRRSMDGLSAVVRDRLGLEPLSGHLFLFRNRRGDRLKVLAWEPSGFWLFYKRLERGTFAWPVETEAGPFEMRASDLMVLLAGVDISATRRRKWYDSAA